MTPIAPARVAALLLLAVAGLAAGCGEKEEPGLSEPAAKTTPVTPDKAFAVAGRWRGRLEQRGVKPFVVTATIRSRRDSKQNTVHYTGIDCSGTWAYVARDGVSYEFEEVIDRGEGGDCKGKGTVTLTPRGDDELDYEFEGGGVTSRGVLERYS